MFLMLISTFQQFPGAGWLVLNMTLKKLKCDIIHERSDPGIVIKFENKTIQQVDHNFYLDQRISTTLSQDEDIYCRNKLG